jgi:tetratricopeptide (TPR) repeat protein
MIAAAVGADTPAIGDQLGVSHLLEGDINHSGQDLCVSIRLIQASDGTCELAERFVSGSTELPNLQHEIAHAVGARLFGTTQTRQIPAREQGTNVSAYHAYLLGRHAHDRMDLESARRHLERAVDLDPEYAPAHDALAETWWCLGFSGIIPPRDAFGRGLWAAHRALEIDDQRADTVAMAAAFRKELDYNWTEVRRGFERARAMDPNHPLVRLRYATSLLMPFGHLAEACHECESALRDDPLSFWMHGWLAVLLQMRRKHKHAVEECRRVLALEPHCAICQQEKAIGLLALGRPADALEAARACAACPPNSPLQLGVLGWACGRTGAIEEARSILAGLKARRRSAYAPASAFALVHTGLDDLDSAVEEMLQAVEERDPIAVSIRYWPPFDPIHDHPRFAEILRGLNFVP